MEKQVAPFAAGPGEEDVERIVCASMSSIEGSTFAQMEAIRKAAVRNNEAFGIHAVLLLQSGWFLHWAEGPVIAVRGLLEHTRRDTRHHSRHIVHHSHGRRLLPTPWSMMVAPSGETPAEMGRRVQALGEQLANGQQRSPQSVVRRLATPLRLPVPQDMVDAESFHRFGIVSAAAQDAFDLVNWLAHKYRGAVVKRRVSGVADLDSGTDYVEFMEHGHPFRAVAVARSNLALGLLRAFLPDWGNLVLMFSGKADADEDLMRRVAAACEGLVSPPLLVGVARDEATHEAMMRTAEAAGLEYLAVGTADRQNYPLIWRAVNELLESKGAPPSSVWAVSEVQLVV